MFTKKRLCAFILITTMLLCVIPLTASGLNHNAHNEIAEGSIEERDGNLILLLPPVPEHLVVKFWLRCSIAQNNAHWNSKMHWEYQEEEITISIYHDRGNFDISFEGTEKVTSRPFYAALENRVLNDDLQGLEPMEIVTGIFPESSSSSAVHDQDFYQDFTVNASVSECCIWNNYVAYTVTYYFYDSEQEEPVDSFQQAVRQCGVCHQSSAYDKLLVRETDFILCGCTVQSQFNPHLPTAEERYLQRYME